MLKSSSLALWSKEGASWIIYTKVMHTSLLCATYSLLNFYEESWKRAKAKDILKKNNNTHWRGFANLGVKPYHQCTMLTLFKLCFRVLIILFYGKMSALLLQETPALQTLVWTEECVSAIKAINSPATASRVGLEPPAARVSFCSSLNSFSHIQHPDICVLNQLGPFKYNNFLNVQTWMSVWAVPAPWAPGVWTHEAPSAANVHLALTWRMDAPAPEVRPLWWITFSTWITGSQSLVTSALNCNFYLFDTLFCSIAKTFLGTFSVNRLPYDPAIFKSHTMHEIQREIIQLVRRSLHHRII